MESDFLVQLLPVLLTWLIFAIPGYFIAKRKGVGFGKFLLGIFPLWAAPFVMWWISLTDKAVLDRLDALEIRR